MQEFINPKSMLTPGVAGSLMMFLVNGITCQFPEIPARYLALSLSFVIGAIVWFSETKGKSLVLQKGIYWILNSLVIFVVGFGAANLAADATRGASASGTPHALLLPSVSSAFAQNPPAGNAPPSGSGESEGRENGGLGSQETRALEEKLSKERAENERLKKQLESMRQENSAPEQPKREQQFFKRW